MFGGSDESVKVRRQKIFVAVGGGVLLVVLFFQFGGAVFSSSGGHSTARPPASSAAVPITHGSATTSGGTGSPLSRTLARLKPQDIFAPQINTGGTGVSVTAMPTSTMRGPAVRAKNFVVKDVFNPQIKPPAATPATSSLVQTPTGGGSAPPEVDGTAGYIIILASIPGVGTASQKAAARAVVAAKNAGLKDVVANNSVPGSSGSAPHFTIYTGPYQYESSAKTELTRALRNGYPAAHAYKLPSSSGKGF
jgi:hypothetical protein